MRNLEILRNKLENNYRKKKREMEIKQVLHYYLEYEHAIKGQNTKHSPIKTLEFGSGEGSQLSYLSSYFDVIATDLYIPDFIKKERFNNYVLSDIRETPFQDNYFDIIFSNHVLEHIKNYDKAFAELKRIGHDNTAYIFCVPTNLWLLLSIPAQYFNKAMKIYNKIVCNDSKSSEGNNNSEIANKKKKFDYIKIKGHGVEQNFRECFNLFKVDSWHNLFVSNSFSVKLIKPLLLYSASDLPIIPIRKVNSIHLCSSVMFILNKKVDMF